MSGIPVVVVERFGLPVKAVEGRAPVMTVSPYGLGIPIVLSEWGAPFVVEGLTPPVLPGSINNLSVLSTTTSTIALAFTDAARATSHEYQLDGGGWVALDPSKVIDSLPPDTSFDVQVRGVNAEGNGPPSNTVQAQTQPIPVGWQSFTMTAGNTAFGWGYAIEPAVSAPFGSIDRQPYTGSTMLGFWEAPDDSRVIVIFAGDVVDQLEGQTFSVDGVPLAVDAPAEYNPGSDWTILFLESHWFEDGVDYEIQRVPAIPTPDFVVTNDIEWDAVLALPPEDLAGKVMAISGSNFTERRVSDKNITGENFTIVSMDENSSIPRFVFGTGNVSGFTFSNIFQMTGWPKDYASCVHMEGGTYERIAFIGASIRHGYGPDLEPVDTAADLPEYERIDNVVTATTTSLTTEMTWKDPACTNGWVEFFNRGTEPVYVEFGGSDVTATTSSALVGAGSRRRFTGVDATTSTHFAVITETGSTQVNARTEVGLMYYLADAFSRAGNANLTDVVVRNCTFTDLGNAIKSLGVRSNNVLIMDNQFDRIYQDNIAMKGDLQSFRNLLSVPFARSGIAEGSGGDARDPHGDLHQSDDQNSPGTITNLISAGNRSRRGPRRAGVQSQGIFWSDNDHSPSYDLVYSINDAMLGGSVNGISCGEQLYPVGRMAVYGATVIHPLNLAGGSSGVRMTTFGDGDIYVGYTIAQNYAGGGDPFLVVDSLRLNNAANPAAVFPAIDTLVDAQSREAIEAAITTAAEGVNYGAEATRSAINWTTQNPDEVIRWDNIPGMFGWDAVVDVEPSDPIEMPARQVLNKAQGQTITAGPGVEWRSLDEDGVSVIQDWTTSPGTVDFLQFIQMRMTAPAGDLETETYQLVSNGFPVTVSVTTKDSGSNDPTEWLVAPGDGYFVDPATLGAGVTHLEFWAKVRATLSSTFRPFALSANGAFLEILSTGTIRIRAQDSSGADVIPLTTVTGITMPNDAWALPLGLAIDHVAQEAVVTVGTVSQAVPFVIPGTGSSPSARNLLLLASSSGGANTIPAGGQVADLEILKNGVSYKTVSNVAATANSDTWKAGAGAFTQGSA